MIAKEVIYSNLYLVQWDLKDLLHKSCLSL